MAKISLYKTDKGGVQLQDFTNEVTNLLNFGKFQIRVTTTDPPNWASSPGEMALTLAGGSANFYVAYSNNILGVSSRWIRIARALT